MNEVAYRQRREEIETYFDRTAADAWARANGMRFRVVTEFDIFKNQKR